MEGDPGSSSSDIVRRPRPPSPTAAAASVIGDATNANDDEPGSDPPPPPTATTCTNMNANTKGPSASSSPFQTGPNTAARNVALSGGVTSNGAALALPSRSGPAPSMSSTALPSVAPSSSAGLLPDSKAPHSSVPPMPAPLLPMAAPMMAASFMMPMQQTTPSVSPRMRPIAVASASGPPTTPERAERPRKVPDAPQKKMDIANFPPEWKECLRYESASSTYFCLFCDTVLTAGRMTGHFMSKTHDRARQKALQRQRSLPVPMPAPTAGPFVVPPPQREPAYFQPASQYESLEHSVHHTGSQSPIATAGASHAPFSLVPQSLGPSAAAQIVAAASAAAAASGQSDGKSMIDSTDSAVPTSPALPVPIGVNATPQPAAERVVIFEIERAKRPSRCYGCRNQIDENKLRVARLSDSGTRGGWRHVECLTPKHGKAILDPPGKGVEGVKGWNFLEPGEQETAQKAFSDAKANANANKRKPDGPTTPKASPRKRPKNDPSTPRANAANHPNAPNVANIASALNATTPPTAALTPAPTTMQPIRMAPAMVPAQQQGYYPTLAGLSLPEMPPHYQFVHTPNTAAAAVEAVQAAQQRYAQQQSMMMHMHVASGWAAQQQQHLQLHPTAYIQAHPIGTLLQQQHSQQPPQQLQPQSQPSPSPAPSPSARLQGQSPASRSNLSAPVPVRVLALPAAAGSPAPPPAPASSSSSASTAAMDSVFAPTSNPAQPSASPAAGTVAPPSGSSTLSHVQPASQQHLQPPLFVLGGASPSCSAPPLEPIVAPAQLPPLHDTNPVPAPHASNAHAHGPAAAQGPVSSPK